MFKKAKPLKDPKDYDHAWQYALFLLNLSMRTSGEVKEKMTRRGYDKKVINLVTNNLAEEKFLDDENYAEVFINSMKNYKSYGLFMMKKKMYEKKLPRELIDEKLDELVSEKEELKIAKRFLEKQVTDLKEIKKMDYEDKQRLMRKLVSRGFGINIATKLIK